MKKLILITLICCFVLLFALTSYKSSAEISAFADKTRNLNPTSNSNSTNPLPHKNEAKGEKPKIKPTNIVELLSQKIDDDPQISSKDLLDYGNELIKKTGYNFDFYSCTIANPENKPLGNDFSENYTAFDYSFSSIKGKNLEFQILSKSWGHPCGCYFEIPLMRASKDELVINQDGKQYSVKHLEKYNIEYVESVSKDLKKTRRKWFKPMDNVPFGISKDGSKIYLETTYYYDNLNNSEKSLVLEIAENGTFQFASKKDPNIISNYEYIEDFPKEKDNDYLGYLKFSDGKNEHILKVSFPCT